MKLEVVFIFNLEGPLALLKSLWPARFTRKNKTRVKQPDNQLEMPLEEKHDGSGPK